MSNNSDRAEGAAEELGGKLKKAIGIITGDAEKEAAGHRKEVSGQLKQETAKAGERVKGTIEQVAGTVEKLVGEVIDNDRMKAHGKSVELKGEARQSSNK